MDSLRIQYQPYFDLAEWTFTIIFSLEYILRLSSVKSYKIHDKLLVIIDLLALLPSYLGNAIGANANNISSIKTIRTIRH